MPVIYGKLAPNPHVLTLVKSIIVEPLEGPRVGSRCIKVSLWLNALEDGDYANAVAGIVYADGHYPREQMLEEITADEFNYHFQKATESF